MTIAHRWSCALLAIGFATGLIVRGAVVVVFLANIPVSASALEEPLPSGMETPGSFEPPVGLTYDVSVFGQGVHEYILESGVGLTKKRASMLTALALLDHDYMKLLELKEKRYPTRKERFGLFQSRSWNRC